MHARLSSLDYLDWIHNACAVTLCPSSTTKADLRSHRFRRLHLWGRRVDTARFYPALRSEEWRASVGVREGKTLLYAGRLGPKKRVDLLAEA